MVMISLSTSPGCGPRFLAGWASSLSSRASQCGRNAWKKSSNWQKSSTSRSNIDASPHLMAPTQEEEFKGDKGLASPQTRNSGYIGRAGQAADRIAIAVLEQPVELAAVARELGIFVKHLAKGILHHGDALADADLAAKFRLDVGRSREMAGMHMRLDEPFQA